jgi:hypothetical protein
MKSIINLFKRLWIILREDGTVFHCGDGYDYITIKDFWIPGKDIDYTSYDRLRTHIESIGFKNLKSDFYCIARQKGKTDSINTAIYNKYIK